MAERWLPPPPGTYAIEQHPGEVRTDDFVLFDGQYHKVVDMRTAGPTGIKVLLFRDRPPG